MYENILLILGLRKLLLIKTLERQATTYIVFFLFGFTR